ncbi:NUDIX hydrolase [Halorussus salinisoli]|uniref:NUDIX hydrolase n=1 Tax=Halorussus salinisoli TaxID=2558242 RepID=UPI0010C1B5B1|nr:NUDIX domain-containing protein [Halorussus salinisoli]
MPTEINEEVVERRTDRLLEEYGDAPVEEETWEDSAAEFARAIEHAENGYLGGAYAWVVRESEDAAPLTDSMPGEARPDARKALMILNRANEKWGLPGGGREGDETFEETVRREVREETGIECAVTDLFLLRHVTAVPESESVAAEFETDRVHFLYVFFDATYEGGSIAIQPGELDGAAWFADPPARMLPANERRAESWTPEAGD